MIERSEVNSLFDARVVDGDDDRIGTVKHVYLDKDTGEPLFVGVVTGLFGTRHSVVPLRGATFDREVLHIGYDKETVKGAPNIDDDSALTVGEEERIRSYYADVDRGGGDDTDADGRDGRHEAGEHEPTGRLRRYVLVPVDDAEQGDTRRSDAEQGDTRRSDAEHAEPVRREPALHDAVREEPVHEDPARAVPGREPALHDVVRDEPVRDSSVGEPVRDASVAEPVGDASVAEPVRDASVSESADPLTPGDRLAQDEPARGGHVLGDPSDGIGGRGVGDEERPR